MARFDARPLEDFSMWAMMQKGGQQADVSRLKRFVEQWIQMATQKNGGAERPERHIVGQLGAHQNGYFV